MPAISVALAMMVKLDPFVNLLPLVGLMMETTGAGGVEPLTVTVIEFEVTEWPVASTALAVKV